MKIEGRALAPFRDRLIASPRSPALLSESGYWEAVQDSILPGERELATSSGWLRFRTETVAAQLFATSERLICARRRQDGLVDPRSVMDSIMVFYAHVFDLRPLGDIHERGLHAIDYDLMYSEALQPSDCSSLYIRLDVDSEAALDFLGTLLVAVRDSGGGWKTMEERGFG